jgi:hypothetical protein
MSCDSNGTSAFSSFGSTSLDCPPTAAGLIATLPIALDYTDTGSRSLTVGAASPNCHAAGFTGLKCPCDVCSLNHAKPCQTDADCLGGEGTCGGAVAGQPTAPNGCTDGDCGALFDERGGACANGPIQQACVKEPFRGCVVASDCPLAGDACASFPRPCFPGFNGNLGDSIVAAGSHGTPVNHAWQPTFASIACSAPTASSAVNFVLGLPGPVRLQVSGRATENGTSSLCAPTQFSFVPFNSGHVLDFGWTGMAHDMKLMNAGKVTVGITGCASGCGVCTYSGPVANPDAVP